MKTLLIMLMAGNVWGQLQLAPQNEPAAVFAGQPTTLQLFLHNPTAAPVEQEIQFRLYQLSFATRVPLGDPQSWKKLRVLPEQTIVEKFPVTLPEVRATARFQVEFPTLGRVEVTAYPPDLLKRLGSLAGDLPLGVYDPDDKLRSLLKNLKLTFADFETYPENSKLAIVWTKENKLPESVTTRVAKGMAVVWVKPVAQPFALVRERSAVVTLPEASVRALRESPLSQQNLIRSAEIALQPELLINPDERNQP